MDVIILLFTIIILGGVLYALLFVLGRIVSLFFKFSEKKKYRYNYLSDPLIDRILSDSFRYYRNLPSRARPAFVARVREFMNSKEFTGKEGIIVTDEMKILISASAIQVTFGLDKFLFDHFKKIFIYPKEYYSRFDKRYHKGEVNLAGAIVFSWEDFKNGYAVGNDNYNLGLHEMAHALRFDKFKNDEFDSFFSAYFEKWMSVGSKELRRLKSGEVSLLREYAGTNQNEFFSVCVEYFFESPREMKEKIPELYLHLCILLNQDPTAEFDPKVPVRRLLFPKPGNHTGELIYASPLTFSSLIFPYFAVFLVLFISSVNKISDHNTAFSTGIAYMTGLALYITAGGFLLSTKFKRLKIYKYAFEIVYSLNPVLKNKLYYYENLISITLREADFLGSSYSESSVSDSITIKYTNGIQIKTFIFPISGIKPADMERVAAFLKRRQVMIKIFGTKWSHETIGRLEKNIPADF